jgi:SAM-dependent methyltransferase
MSQSKYIFTDTTHVSELRRLQTIERIFDPASRSLILATGLAEGWDCLEVGAGAGAIAKWMTEIVGETGGVSAVDLDARFIKEISLPNFSIFEGDIRVIPFVKDAFDLIHLRYVLIHIPDFEAVLSRLLGFLKPNGWLVIEEPDFSVAKAIAGDRGACESFDRINQAIFKIYADKGTAYDLGIKLPAIIQNLGLQKLSVENDSPISGGGSALATMMKMSAMQLAEKYLETGLVTQQDIENYCEFAENPNCLAIYYATVRTAAQKI